MIKLIFTEKEIRRFIFLLISVLIGITIGYLTLPFIADHELLPRVHKTQIEKESSYQGYGVTEEQYTTTYETKEDQIQDYKNMVTIIFLQTLTGLTAFFTSCLFFVIIELLIHALRRKPK